ncbi:MAG: STAS domain-containing protein [Candidatus Marinimicrobia bacterium]|nr:STAS domain-containing protein [Candidatus Neomarinimicrobiota bacterium]
MSTTPVTITPEADIVGNATYELKREFSELIKSGQLQIRLDLAKVTLIDSLGIGVLVATRNSVRQSDGEFSIINLSADLTQLFSNMGIIEFLNIS